MPPAFQPLDTPKGPVILINIHLRNFTKLQCFGHFMAPLSLVGIFRYLSGIFIANSCTDWSDCYKTAAFLLAPSYCIFAHRTQMECKIIKQPKVFSYFFLSHLLCVAVSHCIVMLMMMKAICTLSSVNKTNLIFVSAFCSQDRTLGHVMSNYPQF